MAASEYHHGDMDIKDQKATWDGFLTFSVWGSLIIFLSVAHAVFTISLGIHWAVSLGILTVAGIAAGLLMNLGGRWMATVVLLLLTGLFVQFMIWLFGVLI